MTTTQDKLAAIRAACIDANPELIEFKRGYVLRGKLGRYKGDIFLLDYDKKENTARVDIGDDFVHTLEGVEWVTLVLKADIIFPPIRLADVLLALQGKDYAISAFGDFLELEIEGWDMVRVGEGKNRRTPTWNLRNDDLDWHAEHQPETIDFLYKLSKPSV